MLGKVTSCTDDGSGIHRYFVIMDCFIIVDLTFRVSSLSWVQIMMLWTVILIPVVRAPPVAFLPDPEFSYLLPDKLHHQIVIG